MLWSPSRSGKSELLDQVHKRFYRGRPAVRRQGDELGKRPYEVVLQLADHLGRDVERFGRLKFPRLFLGMLAIRGPLNKPATNRAEMIRRTVPDRERLKQWAHATSGALLDAVAADKPTRVFVGLVVEGVLARLETVPLLRGQGLRWYREGLGLHFTDPIEALVDLAAQEANGRRTSVDEVLCRAFLADLRDGCSNKFRQLYDRNQHCLAVLDDADSPAAQAFFEILGTQRAGQWDPLLIVAGSSRRISNAEHPNTEQWPVRSAHQASYADWIQNRNVRQGWAALYPVTLGGITEAEATTCFAPRIPDNVARLRGEGIKLAGVPGGAEHAVTFAHQLTDGHLGGLRLALQVLTRERVRAVDEPMDLRRLLEWPDQDGTALAETILHWILDPWPASIRRLLISSSAARDFGDIALARVLQGEPARQLIIDFRSRDTWVRHGDGPPALHPLARRVLLHQLAKPGGPGWQEVHERLRQRAESHGDRTSALYHELAAGRVGEVAQALSELFSQPDTAQWFDTLLTVTGAPLENPARQQDSESHCQWLTARAGAPSLVSARLIAALQLHADPLADPNRDLCRVVAHELEALANHAPEGGLVFLLKKAEEFRRRTEEH
ncbi:MAG: hypothetical protein ACRDTC_18875 [Pseudonocardiaceae bacterium]